MNRQMIKNIMLSLILVAASMTVSSASSKDDKPSIISNRLIVKFKDSGPYALKKSVASLLKGNKKFFSATQDGSDSLDKIKENFKVMSAKPLFSFDQGSSDNIADVNASLTNRLTDVQKKFAKRTQRGMHKDELNKNFGHIYVMEVADGVDVQAVCDQFKKDPHVEYCHPDYLLKAQSVYNPNDPYFSSYGTWRQNDYDMWNLRRTNVVNQQTGESAWDITQGENIVVAVIDTGLDYNHPDIQGNVWTNPNEIPGNGIDDDGNGYVDDVRGWNFESQNNEVMDNLWGHGTLVSGIIAAVGNNNQGIIGVAPKAKIMVLKIPFSTDAAAVSKIIEAIMYAINNGADIINLSWGTVDPVASIPALEDAIRLAHDMGLVVLVPSGNLNADSIDYSPANMKETITVAGTDINDQRAVYDRLSLFYGFNSASNYGNFVDVSAPSRDLISLNARQGANVFGAFTTQFYLNQNYMMPSGTSVAVAHASGLAALLLAHDPSLSNEDVRQIMRSSATDINGLGFDVDSGFGIINALKALQTTSVPRVWMDEPKQLSENNSLDKQMVVKGQAYGTKFKSYQMSYRPLDQETGWINVDVPHIKPVAGTDTDNALGALPIRQLNLADGNYLVKVEVTTTDDKVFQDMVQLKFKAVNRPPVFDPIVDQKITPQKDFTLTVKATDLDGDQLTYSINNLPDGASFQTKSVTDSSTGEISWVGVFSWKPSNKQVGTYPVQFSVADTRGASTTSNTVSLTVQKNKEKPKITSLFTLGEFLFWESWDKEDKDSLQYSYRINQGEWSKLKNTNILWLQGLNLSPGDYYVEVKAVADDSTESDTVGIRVKIPAKSLKK